MTQTLADLDDDELPPLSKGQVQLLRADIDSGFIAAGLDDLAAQNMAEGGAGLARLLPRVIKSIDEALAIPFDETRKNYAVECRMKAAAWAVVINANVRVDGDRLKAKQSNSREKILAIVAQERERIKVIEAQVVHHYAPSVDLAGSPAEDAPSAGDGIRRPE